MTVLRSILSCTLVMLMAAIAESGLYAQVSPDPVVYRFSVAGVVNPVQAKDVQYHLRAFTGTIDVVFIDECDCFKWTTTELLDHAGIASALLAGGHILENQVETSDGRTLLPELPMIHAR